MPHSKPTPTLRQAVLYARVSKDEQASDEHFSIEAQFGEMREFVQEKGWEVVAEIMDDMSGQKVKRPGLDAVMDMAKNQAFDVLVVHELSRLSRASVYETLEIFQELGNYNVGFASVKEPDFNFADPSKRFFLILLAALNQYYIDLLRVHTQKGKRERARQGLYNASIPPYGYTHTGSPQDPPVIDQQEAENVQRIFEQYATGNYSHLQIAEALNNDGLRTRPTRRFPTGKRFAKAHIGRILKNIFYTGKIAYGTRDPDRETEFFDGQHQPIITFELFERCRQVREKRRANARNSIKPHRVYLLSTLARCDVCGRKLRSQTNRGIAYYREMSNLGGYVDCPNRDTGTPADPIEKQIHAIIDQVRLPQEWLEEVAERISDAGELRGISKQHERLESERRRLKLMKIRGEFDEDPELYNREIVRIRKEMDQLPSEDELENLKDSIAIIEDLPETWSKASPRDQRDLLRLMLRSVLVDVPVSRVTGLQPHATFIPILRKVPLLQERDFGFFVPVWPVTVVPESGGQKARSQTRKTVLAMPVSPTASPFVMANPLQPDHRNRMTTGISAALRMASAKTKMPEMVLQLVAPDRPALPVNLKRWPTTAYFEIAERDLLQRPEHSVDVLISQFLLWDKVQTGRDSAEALLPQAFTLLAPGGVWYFQDLLPTEMPAHWLYQIFPPAWETLKARSWSLHTFHQLLQQTGFRPRIVRHRHEEPVAASFALGLADQDPRLRALLSKGNLEAGLAQFKDSEEGNGRPRLLSSELVMIEGWAQVPAKKEDNRDEE